MRSRSVFCGLIVGVMIASMVQTAIAQGIQAPGIGTVNRSMGGASVAAPLDPIGALHWNPATISGLRRSELAVSVESSSPTAEIRSTVAPFFSGGDSTDSGFSPIPSIGLVLSSEESPLSFGLGIFGVAGYAVNYSSSATNPIAFPQTPTPATPFPGLGRINAEVQLMQIAPSVSLEVVPGLSVAAGPTFMTGKLMATPFVFDSPDDANGDGIFTYPVGMGTRFHWGGGFQVGAYLETDFDWNFGASFKSPQWFETFTYKATDEVGLPRGLRFDIDYPMIISLGTAYKGFEYLLLAADVRWTDYSSADGFGDTAGFDPTGRVLGLGWKSVWSMALGGQYTLTEDISLRAGYTFAESPITNETAGFNVASPLVLRHSANLGASFKLTDALSLHVAYHHIFPSSVSGPFQSPAGPVPGTNVEYSIGANSISVGLSTTF